MGVFEDIEQTLPWLEASIVTGIDRLVQTGNKNLEQF